MGGVAGGITLDNKPALTARPMIPPLDLHPFAVFSQIHIISPLREVSIRSGAIAPFTSTDKLIDWTLTTVRTG
jgi:hypothetical protein